MRCTNENITEFSIGDVYFNDAESMDIEQCPYFTVFSINVEPLRQLMDPLTSLYFGGVEK